MSRPRSRDMRAWWTGLLVLSLLACSPAGQPPDGGEDAGGTDAGLSDAGDAGMSDAAIDAGADAQDGGASSTVTGDMALVQADGVLPEDGGPQPVRLLEAFASFQGAVAHDYDDTHAGYGCTADHYDAATRPMPQDDDAGWLRMSGFAGGLLLSGAEAGQPIVCMQQNGYYSCAFPTGALVTGPPYAAFPASTDALGSGSIMFAAGGGSAFGPTTLSDSPTGTLTVQEDLNAISYSSLTDSVLHVSCTDGCPSTRFGVRLIALQASSIGTGWPFASVGVVDCHLPTGPSLTLPGAAIATMLGGDARLDTVWTTVVRLPATPMQKLDRSGNLLIGEVGRGVFGVARR